MPKSWKMTETLAHGYSSESTQWELSNEYPHDRVQMTYKNLCVLVPSTGRVKHQHMDNKTFSHSLRHRGANIHLFLCLHQNKHTLLNHTNRNHWNPPIPLRQCQPGTVKKNLTNICSSLNNFSLTMTMRELYQESALTTVCCPMVIKKTPLNLQMPVF